MIRYSQNICDHKVTILNHQAITYCGSEDITGIISFANVLILYNKYVSWKLFIEEKLYHKNCEFLLCLECHAVEHNKINM